MLCADLVEVCWWDQTGAAHAAIANIEDISTQGTSLVLDNPLSVGAEVQMRCLRGDFSGRVVYCRPEVEFGYVAGIEFSGGSRWSVRKYRPRHLLDPHSLAKRGPGARLAL